MFENLLLLGKKGEPLYFGEVGHRGSAMVDYFEGMGAPKCPDEANPAEWVLRVTGEDEHFDSMHHGHTEWYSKWRSSEQRRQVQHELTRLRALSDTPTDPVSAGVDGEYALPIFLQITVLCRRMFQDQWREPATLYCKIGLCILLALVNGISFYNPPHDIQGLISLLFSVFLLAQMFSSVTRLVTIRFVAGRDLFETREGSSKMYHWAVFISSNMLVETAYYTLISVPVFVCW
jgi:ATP-binding cassette, subfamily G (WHITE), member 2, PDR